MLRLLLGILFVFFVPGYVLQLAIFPRSEDLDGPERLALSFGLSIAVIPPMALILDRLPWGIRLVPILVIEGLFIVACSAIAWWRRRRMPQEERFVIAVEFDPKGWWAAQGRLSRGLYILLACALVGMAISAVAIIVAPNPSEHFTEFYVLGPEGLAEGYPREAVVGQPLTVTLGISNLEGVSADYRVEIRVGDQQIGSVGSFSLGDGLVWEGDVSYALPQAGADQQVEFFLYRDGGGEPYRSLLLWIDVVEEEEGS
jgi:uncharacterized membrane protein